MKVSLYPCFKHWTTFQNIWIYSDPHFSDEESQYFRRNYPGDEEQVKRINSKVGKRDMIIFLGDICNTEYIKQIKGYKVLVMGNHDKGASNYIKNVVNGTSNRHTTDCQWQFQAGLHLLRQSPAKGFEANRG